MGHELNNSLAPIKSIAGSLNARLSGTTLAPEERQDFERGLGIPLIRALVDEVEFSSSDDGTAVRLVMHHDDELDGNGR